MNQFESIIGNNGHSLQIIIFVLLFIVSWNIENIAGALYDYKKWKHAILNAPFIITNIPGQTILGLAFLKCIEWTGRHQFGLLYHLHHLSAPFVSFIIIFIVLDFGEYVYHVVMHKVKRLWMFHAVHHTDNVVDISTTFREHPGENIIRLSFTLVWVFLTGCPIWMLMLRQIIQAASTLYAHVNYRLSDKTDRFISLLFITPNLHQVHHHFRQPYTDSNYGDVLSIWDGLFGTLKRLPANQLCFGVDTLMEEGKANNFKILLCLPFKKMADKSKKKIKDSEEITEHEFFLSEDNTSEITYELGL